MNNFQSEVLLFLFIQDDLRVAPPKKRKKAAVIELDDSD